MGKFKIRQYLMTRTREIHTVQFDSSYELTSKLNFLS
jgi:hypothetical protein